MWSQPSAGNASPKDSLKWLHENRTEGCTTRAMDWAADKGHLDVMIWLHENRTEGCTTYTMNRVAWNGHLDAVKFLQETDYGVRSS